MQYRRDHLWYFEHIRFVIAINHSVTTCYSFIFLKNICQVPQQPIWTPPAAGQQHPMFTQTRQEIQGAESTWCSKYLEGQKKITELCAENSKQAAKIARLSVQLAETNKRKDSPTYSSCERRTSHKYKGDAMIPPHANEADKAILTAAANAVSVHYKSTLQSIVFLFYWGK